MDDATSSNPLGGRFEDIEGLEYEVGVSWKMFPFVSMRAGYRETTFDFTETNSAKSSDDELDGTIESKGFLLGLGFHF